MTRIIFFLLSGLMFSHVVFADEPDVGEKAPDFEITRMDGKKFKLSDFKGKKSVYLVFWNTWCHYCVKKIPKLKDAQIKLSDDIEIIAINTTREDSISEIKSFNKRFQINYPVAFDSGEKVTDLYNVWGTPTEFIIDINGIIRYRDDVPDKLEDYLGEWNSVKNLFSDLGSAYMHTIAFFSGAVNHSRCNETAG